MIDVLISPLALSLVLVLVLFAMILGMMFGKKEGHSQRKTWAYRGAGVEIFFVFFPFVLHSIVNALSGSFLKFLTTPELPMASMIVSGMAMVSLLKGLYVSKGHFFVEGFLVLFIVFLAIFMGCGGLVVWLALQPSVSPWFGVLNCLLVIFSVGFSFAVTAAMNHVVRNPEEVGIRSQQ